MKVTLFSLIGLLFVASVYAEDRVQISDERDAAGKFTNWTDLTVTWDSDITADIPDPSSVDDDSLQEWFVPVPGGWLGFNFVRSVKGQYAIRWSHDGELWSEPGVCTIVPLGQAKHKD